MSNLGIPGVKVADVLKYEVPQAVTLMQDFVKILIGINDVHNVTSLDRFQADYTQMIDLLKNNGNPRIYIIDIPYLGSHDLIKFPFDIYFHSRISGFNQAIKQVALKEEVALIELNQGLAQLPIVDSVYYSPDGFHPTTEGYKTWGQIIDKNF